MDGAHMDTVDGARLKTEFAAGALAFDYRMHPFGGTQDGINRAGLEAQGTADTELFIDVGHHGYIFFFAHFFIKGDRVAAQKVGQGLDTGFATRRTAVNLRLAGGNRLGIGAATGKAALAALGLGQDGIDLIDNRISLHLEAYRGITQHQPEHGGEYADCEDGAQQGRITGLPGRRSP